MSPLFLFPEKYTCDVCGRENFNGKRFCDRCLRALPAVGPGRCLVCGRPLPLGGVCEDCKSARPAFDLARASRVYAPPASALVHALKYGGKKYLAAALGEEIALVARRENLAADAAVFVPMSERERAKRGFNQSELIARAAAEELGIRVSDAAEKVRETARQATLGKAERVRNLERAFRVKDKKAVAGRTLFVIDDVITTGATLSELAGALKRAGAARVYALCFCAVAASAPLSTKKNK